MALPYPRQIDLPSGDSLLLRWPQPRDATTGVPVDPRGYDDVRCRVVPEGREEEVPAEGDPAIPAVVKVRGDGLVINDDDLSIDVELAGTDTQTLPIGSYVIQLRFEDFDGRRRHTVLPMHRLSITASPL